jgi:hypothetical protein
MRRTFSVNALVVVISAAAALLLTIVRPAPEGVISFGMGEVRAAPGQSTGAVARHDLDKLKVFNSTLLRVTESYVDPVRVDPKKMLFQALDSVQFNIPEVLVEPYPDPRWWSRSTTRGRGSRPPASTRRGAWSPRSARSSASSRPT